MIYFTTDVLAENVLYTKESQIFKWFDEGKLIHHTVADDGIEGDFVEFFNLIDFVINESMIMKSNIYVSRLYRWINRNRKFVKEELPDFLKSETFKKIKCISNIPDTKDFYILYESIYDITDDSKIEIIEPDRNFVKNFIVLKVAGNNDIIDVREICTNNISYIKHWYGKKYVCYKSEFKYKFYSDCDVLSERLKKFLHLVRTTHPNAGFDSNDPYFDSISVAKKLLKTLEKIKNFLLEEEEKKKYKELLRQERIQREQKREERKKQLAEQFNKKRELINQLVDEIVHDNKIIDDSLSILVYHQIIRDTKQEMHYSSIYDQEKLKKAILKKLLAKKKKKLDDAMVIRKKEELAEYIDNMIKHIKLPDEELLTKFDFDAIEDKLIFEIWRVELNKPKHYNRFDYVTKRVNEEKKDYIKRHIAFSKRQKEDKNERKLLSSRYDCGDSNYRDDYIPHDRNHFMDIHPTYKINEAIQEYLDEVSLGYEGGYYD